MERGGGRLSPSFLFCKLLHVISLLITTESRRYLELTGEHLELTGEYLELTGEYLELTYLTEFPLVQEPVTESRYDMYESDGCRAVKCP